MHTFYGYGSAAQAGTDYLQGKAQVTGIVRPLLEAPVVEKRVLLRRNREFLAFLYEIATKDSAKSPGGRRQYIRRVPAL